MALIPARDKLAVDWDLAIAREALRRILVMLVALAGARERHGQKSQPVRPKHPQIRPSRLPGIVFSRPFIPVARASPILPAMWKRSTDWNGEREALGRIVVALAAIAGLLDAAWFCLPRDIYCAVARPLRAAEAAARRLPADPVQGSTAAAHLKSCFAALVRALDALVRGLVEPAPEPIRASACAVRDLPAGPQATARRERRDSS